MKNILTGLLAGAIVAVPLAAVAGSGAAPREVSLSVPCQRPNQLNCSWYGEKIKPSEYYHPSSTYWTNIAMPDGTYCQYRLVPIRGEYCSDTWPFKWYEAN